MPTSLLTPHQALTGQLLHAYHVTNPESARRLAFAVGTYEAESLSPAFRSHLRRLLVLPISLEVCLPSSSFRSCDYHRTFSPVDIPTLLPMEALSGAASGIAVVSLTIQLIQSVALIREFIKDVKGASKELYRLVGKLELLNALLEDAQKVLEQQSSLLDMHFPGPSMAIFKCLQDCEKSIEPLVEIVKKLSLPQSQSSSSTSRLKSEIKLGLRTKEITTLETRIQHDIDLLTTSLSVNQNSIL